MKKRTDKEYWQYLKKLYPGFKSIREYRAYKLRKQRQYYNEAKENDIEAFRETNRKWARLYRERHGDQYREYQREYQRKWREEYKKKHGVQYSKKYKTKKV